MFDPNFSLIVFYNYLKAAHHDQKGNLKKYVADDVLSKGLIAKLVIKLKKFLVKMRLITKPKRSLEYPDMVAQSLYMMG